jgi:hypothetical protein
LPWFEFESEKLWLFYSLSILCGESHFLVSWSVSDRCGMADSNKDRGRSKRLGAYDREWSSIGRVLGGWTIGRSSDTVYGLHRAQGDEECEFLGLA